MNFHTKNFRYITDSFGNIMEKIRTGGRLYLRSLSREKPSQAPADIYQDFPELAKDFVIPDELSFIKDKIHSSVLRVSGRVNMWLHYDVRHELDRCFNHANSSRSWQISIFRFTVPKPWFYSIPATGLGFLSPQVPRHLPLTSSPSLTHKTPTPMRSFSGPATLFIFHLVGFTPLSQKATVVLLSISSSVT